MTTPDPKDPSGGTVDPDDMHTADVPDRPASQGPAKPKDMHTASRPVDPKDMHTAR